MPLDPLLELLDRALDLPAPRRLSPAQIPAFLLGRVEQRLYLVAKAIALKFHSRTNGEASGDRRGANPGTGDRYLLPRRAAKRG
jgi:hypothetical protein